MTSGGRRAATYWKALNTLGPGWAVQRLRLEILKKLGVIKRRTPAVAWESLSLTGIMAPGIPVKPAQYAAWRSQSAARFFFDALPGAQILNALGRASLQMASQIEQGAFPFFGYSIDAGYPPKWARNPRSGTAAPDLHWTEIDEFAFGDVKLYWEFSRFSWAYALARAYARTRDESYPATFWSLTEDWMLHNPPNLGINWKCGQEAAFRAMALCFALHAFRDSPESTPDRVAHLVTLLAITGRRIDAFLQYARSQKNNHGLSEAAGLWTIGLLFPELREARDWRKKGRQLIEFETRRQIYGDGSYIQHSLNYHRVMLHDLAWSIRLGELNNDPFPSDIYDRFRSAVRFLHQFVDPLTGWAPNYGANDGALVLPLSDCEFPDMRPVLQSCACIAEKRPLYPSGPWDEETIWLSGAAALADEPTGLQHRQSPHFSAGIGGYYKIQSENSWAMIRGARYRDRPSHADQLHLDLWWCGENVLPDPGSFSYNEPDPFSHAFADTRYHNTVTFGSAGQMTRLSRFLWADWAQAQVAPSAKRQDRLALLQGEHDGYSRAGAIHRRAVVHPAESIWIVVDDLIGSGKHNARIHWLIKDAPLVSASPDSLDLQYKCGTLRIVVVTENESALDLVRCGERIAGTSSAPPDPARGWISRYYGKLDAALSLAVESNAPLPIRFVSVILLGDIQRVRIDSSNSTIDIGDMRFQLSSIGASPIEARAA